MSSKRSRLQRQINHDRILTCDGKEGLAKMAANSGNHLLHSGNRVLQTLNRSLSCSMLGRYKDSSLLIRSNSKILAKWDVLTGRQMCSRATNCIMRSCSTMCKASNKLDGSTSQLIGLQHASYSVISDKAVSTLYPGQSLDWRLSIIEMHTHTPAVIWRYRPWFWQ